MMGGIEYTPEVNAAFEAAGGRPKPERRQRTKDRKDRREQKIKREVRKACETRDGYCLVQKLGLPGCKGDSTWAHFNGHRRSQTRGMSAERRHDSRFSGMLCTRHHIQEERGAFEVVYHTDKYADGRVSWEPRSEKAPVRRQVSAERAA